MGLINQESNLSRSHRPRLNKTFVPKRTGEDLRTALLPSKVPSQRPRRWAPRSSTRAPCSGSHGSPRAAGGARSRSSRGHADLHADRLGAFSGGFAGTGVYLKDQLWKLKTSEEPAAVPELGPRRHSRP